MRLFLFFLISVFWMCNLVAQTQINIDSLQKQSRNLIYTDHLKSIKISDYILQNTEVNSVKYKENLTKSENYFLQKDFSSALEQLKNLNDLTSENAYLEIKKQLLLIEISDSLNLDLNTKEMLASVKGLLPKIKDPDQAKQAKFYAELLSAEKSNRSFLQLEKEIEKSSFPDKLNLLNKVHLKIATNYLHSTELDSALIYYSKIERNPGSYFYFHSQIGKAQIFKKQEKPDESNKVLFNLISSNHKMKDVFLPDIYKDLSDNYFRKNQLNEFSFYKDLYLKTFDKEFESKQKARLKILDFIEFERIKYHSASIDIYWKIIYGAGFFLLLILFFLIYKLIRIQQKTNRKRQEEKNKEWLESSKKEMEARFLEEKNVPFVIPEKTEVVILDKLKKFEKGNQYLNADLSLNSLAKEFNTNTSYLSEIINKHIGKNFKTYINELRIRYITQKMKENPEYLTYKISYLADEAGFTSRTSFTTIFKSVTGVSPSVFIESLQQNNKE